MKPPFLLSLLFVLLAPGVLPAAERAPIVVLISVDGLAADYFADARADLPTLRRMARDGARAESMMSVFPTVTWPNHTSMVTGVWPARHGVVGNRYYDRAARQDIELLWDPTLDKEDLVLAPTIYDVVHRAGLKTAGVAWPASRNARHLDWQVPAAIDPALLTRHTTPSLLGELQTLGIPLEKKPEWSKIDGGGKLLWDWLHTRIAQHLLQHHRPNLLLLHLDAVDALQHRNGRNSPEAYWAANIVDQYIGRLLETARDAGLRDRLTVVVVSDHGFRNYTKQIHLAAVLRELGLIRTAGSRVVESRVHLIAMSGGACLYITDEANRAAIARDLAGRLRALEGVETVLGADEIVAAGLPAPGPASRAPDLMLSAAEGYAFSGNLASQDVLSSLAGGVKGAHGHLPSGRGMQGTFIACGAAIKAGVTLPQVRAIDIAPTLAAVLGVALPDIDGRVLTEVLR